MNDLKLIYDYSLDPNSFSLADKMIIPLAGGLLLFYILKKGIKKHRVITIIAACTAILIGVTTGSIQYLEFKEISKQMQSGDTKKVQGKITNYTPIDTDDHNSFESYEVNGVKFFYSDYHRQIGYHHACANGGVICGNDQEVAFEYLELGKRNLILKIELPKDWKPASTKQIEKSE